MNSIQDATKDKQALSYYSYSYIINISTHRSIKQSRLVENFDSKRGRDHRKKKYYEHRVYESVDDGAYIRQTLKKSMENIIEESNC